MTPSENPNPWEPVAKDLMGATDRLAVPGGWLYRLRIFKPPSYLAQGVKPAVERETVVFVADVAAKPPET